MAAFGWSAGDVFTALQLVNSIVSSLKSVGGSRDHFRELVTELGGLERALTEISDLTGPPEQIPEIHALKFASCACTETLQRFYEKIKPFDGSLGSASTKSTLKAAPRMVRWELLVKKDIPELRTYLVAHVGSLNLRLSTALLKTTANSRKIASVDHAELLHTHQQQFQKLNAHLLKIRNDVAFIHNEDTIPTLNSLVIMMTNVWQSNNQLMDMLIKLKEQPPVPDLGHTWAQQPAVLFDALGRRIVIPSEYDFEMIEAVIQARFRKGPGSVKVKSGEYELFDSANPEILLDPTHELLPGMQITMSIVIGQYSRTALASRCPKPDCRSRLVKGLQFMHCHICCNCYRITQKHMFFPLRPTYSSATYSSGDVNCSSDALKANLDQSRLDRRLFKNTSICFMPLSMPYPQSWMKQMIRRLLREDMPLPKLHDTIEKPPPRLNTAARHSGSVGVQSLVSLGSSSLRLQSSVSSNNPTGRLPASWRGQSLADLHYNPTLRERAEIEAMYKRPMRPIE